MSPSTDTVWIVVAAYNEARVIRSVLADLLELYDHVLVVDDGSQDATAPEARSAGVTVVEHPINLGQGAALQTGIEAALALGADYVVTYDADGQHRPKDVEELVEALVQADVDVALGNRFTGTARNMPRLRKLILMAASVFTELTTGVRISDPHNGLRAFTAGAASRLEIRQNRMAHASEIIAEIGRHDLSYVEVPVEVRYTDYSLEKGQQGLDAINVLMDLITGKINH